MSYYLGKVGRAGARLVSSARDLYYDVNAAYLTGAVDIIAVRQADGSIKTTPFHARFGKLGVLRTGDWKEVEMVVNGEVANIQMRIDESGQAFFVEPKICESTSESTATDGESKDDDLTDVGSKQPSFDGQENPSHLEQTQKSHDSRVIRPRADQPNSAPSYMNAIVEESLLKDKSDERLPPGGAGEDPAVGGRERRESELSSQSEEGGAEGGVDHYSSSLPFHSDPIGIPLKDLPALGYDDPDQCTDVCCALPLDLEVLSDSAIDDRPRHSGGGSRALSDTEVEVKDRLSSKLWEWSSKQPTKGLATPPVRMVSSQEEAKRREPQQATVDRTGFWSTLTGILKRRKRRRFSSIEDGIYLDDIDPDMDPEELSKFFPSSSTGEATSVSDQAGSSGIGSSPTLSPTLSHHDFLSASHTTAPHQHTADPHRDEEQRLVSTLDDVALSLCGGLGQGTISEEAFLQSQVSFADFRSDPPSLFSNPNLVVRVAGKYYTWQVAATMIMAAVVYLKPMSQDDTSKMVKKYMPRKSKQSFWYFWGSGSKELPDEDFVHGEVKAKSEGGTPVGSPRKWLDGDGVSGGRGEVLSSDEEAAPVPQTRPRQRSLKRKKNLSNHLTAEQLARLALKPGANEVVFSVTTKYQGTAKAQCTLYLWNCYDKIVVSDVDGTITRSDVAGHVFPFFGKDWTQNGVVELFTAVRSNGYHILYLSARAIGQAGYTKEFLRKIRRGSASLPDGPLCLAPFSLVTAFKKEVIEKCPEEFKIMCLKQICSVFPEDINPFHAGFGNKPSDVKTYAQVGIPRSRIFTVNHKGILKHDLSLTFQSSYTGLMEFVDAQFPSLKTTEAPEDQQNTKEEFNTFNYWREPISHYELPFLLPNL